MKLVLVRHGQSAHNIGNEISGGGSNPELSQQGIKKVREISKYFDPQKIDSVYASPLARAYKTAEILTRKEKAIHIDQRLVEMKFGEWEGRDDSGYRDKYPDAFTFIGMFSPNYVKYDRGAESYVDLISRTRNFMNDLKKKEAGHTVLVVCHGFTIRGILAGLLHLNIADVGTTKNVSFTEIIFDEKDDFRPLLLDYNSPYPRYFGLPNNETDFFQAKNVRRQNF